MWQYGELIVNGTRRLLKQRILVSIVLRIMSPLFAFKQIIEGLYNAGRLAPYIDYVESAKRRAEKPSVNSKLNVYDQTGGGGNPQDQGRTDSSDFFNEQIRAIELHWLDLRVEAKGWRKRIWLPSLHELEFEGSPHPERRPLMNYHTRIMSIPSLSSTSPNAQQLFDHLESDIPEAFNKIGEWQGKAMTLLREVAKLQWDWSNRIDERWRKLARFHGRSLDAPYVTFSRTLWKTIVENYFLRLSGDEPTFDGEYQIALAEPRFYQKGTYLLYHKGKQIGGVNGDNLWLGYLQELHQSLYHEMEDLLLEEMRSFECFERYIEVDLLADQASHELDIISLGGAMFKPGNCQYCSQIVA